MMSEIAVRVRNLSKAYRLGRMEERSDTLVGAAINVLKAPMRNLKRLQRLDTFASDRDAEDILWALNDVSFDIRRGEVVGFVGRNGAGKSTLLKVLSRITEPTSGRVEIRGRVSSLLEVGTGFHPELTGRENVYMNGTILGMKKHEIDNRFDEIVAFSGVEKFLDTPVKRYSSGMKVRLAFSVAAHLEPEILIVDEVLAVGDADFQKKCLGKMEKVAGSGRTVLFVSHNLGAIQSLCSRAVALRGGQLIDDGQPSEVVERYLSATMTPNQDLRDLSDRQGSGAARFIGAQLRNESGGTTNNFLAGQSTSLEFEYEVFNEIRRLRLSFTIVNAQGIPIANLHTDLYDLALPTSTGRHKCCCTIGRLPLVEGDYRISAALRHGHELLDLVPNLLNLHVSGVAYYDSGKKPMQGIGVLCIEHSWSLQQQ